MPTHKKQPQRQPDMPAGLPGNDKASMRVSSHALLGAANELIIEHEGREYRLRLTQNRKLILTA
jgi:hemin uptake protein HemP